MNKKWVRSLFRRRVTIIILLLVQISLFLYFLMSSSKTSSVISVVLSAVSFFVVLYIISKKDKGAYKLIWMLLILTFPLFGGVLYLIFNFQTSSRVLYKKITEIEQETKELFCLPGVANEEAEKSIPQYVTQINYLQNTAGFPIYTNSTVKYLSPGETKFETLLEELEKAEKYIFLEYFIVQEGTMWDTILEVLKRKVTEGVKVRLMYDDMGCFLLLPEDYPKQLEKYGIECVVFNKFRPFLTSVQNNRDHRKIVSIDGKVAFTGGINLADEYINAIEKHGHWKDSAVMVKGKAAWSFTLMFLQMWKLNTGINENFNEYYPWKNVECTEKTDGFVQPYADSPVDRENVGEHVYLQIINSAREYVYICTPYLIIDDSMVSALTLASKSGVDVRIITPLKWDKRFVHITTRSYYRELINAGVKVYEYSKGFVHSKTVLSDSKVATVGTANMDFRSLYLNFECGVRMYGTSAIADMEADFKNTMSVSRQITEDDCKCGFFKRIIQEVLRIFAPLM